MCNYDTVFTSIKQFFSIYILLIKNINVDFFMAYLLR
jgi:hypothetical protein